MTLRERFESKVEKSSLFGCWLWTGTRTRTGYGQVWRVGLKRESAHRVAFELFVRPLEPGEWVLHDCDNPSCVNPAHLHVGDQRMNQREAVARRRHRETAKTHCPQGHPYDEQNTSWRTRGGRLHRRCRTCHTERCRARHWALDFAMIPVAC